MCSVSTPTPGSSKARARVGIEGLDGEALHHGVVEVVAVAQGQVHGKEGYNKLCGNARTPQGHRKAFAMSCPSHGPRMPLGVVHTCRPIAGLVALSSGFGVKAQQAAHVCERLIAIDAKARWKHTAGGHRASRITANGGPGDQRC